MKTTYAIRVDVEIDMDEEKPESVTAAGTLMAKLAAGQLVDLPEGVAARVTAGKPKIVRSREG